MSLFSGIFRSRHQEHDTHPPLSPRLGQATQIKTEIVTAIPSSAVKGDFKDETGGEPMSSVYIDFESLYERIGRQLLELQSLRSAHQDALNTIMALQSAHKQDTNTINTLRYQLSQISTESKQNLKNVTSQRNQLVSQKDQTIADLRAELGQQQKAFAHREQEHRTKEKSLLQDERLASSKALARANQAVDEQRNLSLQVAQRTEEGQRLPRGILRSSFTARPVQPFVVVLIDGDAYKFARDLTSDRLLGGARAAERLRCEIFKYMVTRTDIPLHSRIVVRVFFNASSQRGKLGKDGLHSTPSVHNFMIRFSETHPLFDFLDCGNGRERADTKIKENFELFINNPFCQGMFLAVCYDGGFVRMLEPYQHLKDTLDKIVLIKAGQIAPGFQSVPLFKFTEFPSVFQELYSLKIGPTGKTLSSTYEPNSADMDVPSTLCTEDTHEPEDMPIEDLKYVAWRHPRRHVRSTATLLGLTSDATLSSVVAWGSGPRPELTTTDDVLLRRSGPDQHLEAPTTTADEKRRVRTKIRALERAIHEKKQAAKQEGIPKTVRKTLHRMAGNLENELSQLKPLVRKEP